MPNKLTEKSHKEARQLYKKYRDTTLTTIVQV